MAGDWGRVASSGATRFSSVPERAASTVAVCALEDTWKNDEDALLAVVLRVVAPEGRLGSSLSFAGSRSRSLLLMPNDRLDAFLVRERWRSSELLDGRLAWADPGANEETSIDGMWMHSKPVLVSRY